MTRPDVPMSLALALLACGTGSAQEARTPLTAELAGFLAEFRRAAQQNDRPGLARLTHGKAEPCSAAALSRAADQQLRVFGTAAGVRDAWYRAASAREIERATASRDLFWPVNPEAVITVRFESEPSRTHQANLMAAREGTEWKWVPLCSR